eukprot:TRINITY_DN2917_c0_g3_i1.p2 TRINITY_DN2917_c0_g3~~TRINITY_DN2917_c0_g3_i1.p2  ORF type:complete len:160 (-),score=53.94 TRINITY_DN2917_c0_g3_i1:169-648(-)
MSGEQPMIISILAGVSSKKVAQGIGKLSNGEDYKAILTTRINSKKLKASLSKDSGSKAMINESLNRLYNQLSLPNTKDLNRVDSRSEDLDANTVEDFVAQEAAGGLTFKRGEEIVGWVAAFSTAFAEIGVKGVVREVLGKEYESFGYEKLMEYVLNVIM